MAGNTKCYRVRMEDGKPEREVVERSPRFADSVAQAAAKLLRGEAAVIRFGDWIELQRAVEQGGASHIHLDSV